MAKKQEPARLYIKSLKDECGEYKDLFKVLYGREPANKQEIQTLTNYVNRGSLSLEFLSLVIERFNLEEVTLGEFFKGELFKKSSRSAS